MYKWNEIQSTIKWDQSMYKRAENPLYHQKLTHCKVHIERKSTASENKPIVNVQCELKIQLLPTETNPLSVYITITIHN